MSLNVAGARETRSPSFTVWSAPASTVGATLPTVTVNVSEPVTRSSSSTDTFTVYRPSSAYT